MNTAKLETTATRTTRPPLQRMQAIHNAIAAGRFPNCRKLGGSLGVAPRTVQRDVDFMRTHLGLPIAYDAAAAGYYYTETVEAFLTQRFNVTEVSVLRQLLSAGRSHLSPEDVAALSNLVEKLSALGGLCLPPERASA